MQRCGAIHPSDRPLISDMCTSLRDIVKQAEQAEAQQPAAAQPLPAPSKRRILIAVQKRQLDDQAESCQSNGDHHEDEVHIAEGQLQCPDCSDCFQCQSRAAAANEWAATRGEWRPVRPLTFGI